jgi:hypothetical protein
MPQSERFFIRKDELKSPACLPACRNPTEGAPDEARLSDQTGHAIPALPLALAGIRAGRPFPLHLPMRHAQWSIEAEFIRG